MNSRKVDEIEFIGRIVGWTFHLSGWLLPQAVALNRILILARKHAALCEKACNEDSSKVEDELRDTEVKISRQVRIVSSFLDVHFQRDPRGHTVQVFRVSKFDSKIGVPV